MGRAATFFRRSPCGVPDAALTRYARIREEPPGASAARVYWEIGQAQARAPGQAPPPVRLPVGFTTFPGEIFAAPRSWAEKSYPSLTYFHQAGRGGHFAAWEEPQLFSEEVRAAFRTLR